MAEATFSAKVTKWLRQKGCYVITTTVIPGVPTGCPDVIALFPGGGWCALEIKASKSSKFQPLQKVTIKKLDEMYFSRVVYPEIWEDVKKELLAII